MTFERPWMLLLALLPLAWAVWEWQRAPRKLGLLLKALGFSAILAAIIGGLASGRAAAVPALVCREAPSLSCVLPCRNEAGNLGRLLPLLADVLELCTPAWEIVLVDDGSTDATPLVMADWARKPGFRVLQLSRNFGKEAAITAGMQAARGEVVVLMDADLQHSPKLIPRFLEHWRAGADVAYAIRESRDDESAFKRLGARLFYALVNSADRFAVPAGAGDFRLMDRAVVDAILALPERNRFMKGLYAWVGFEAVAVPYVPEARTQGRSNYSPLHLMRLSLDGLTAFTTWPLRAVSVLGFVLATLAFGYGGYLILQTFSTATASAVGPPSS